jgi:hypothetical protein
MPPTSHPHIHAQLLWRPAAGAEQLLAAYDNVPGMNVDDTRTLGAVGTACGDALVARIELVAIDGGGNAEIGVKLALP